MNYKEAVQYLKERCGAQPEFAIVLGSGLSSLADLIEDKIVIPYDEIPGFVQSTVKGHKGNLIFGNLSGRRVVCQQGRFHYYEGWTLEEVTFPVRVFAKLGVKYYLATNAAGSLNVKLQPGQIVLLEDHINFIGENPLHGPNKEEFGIRFPSLHEAYDIQLREIVKKSAIANDIPIEEGVYVAVAGPSFETKAECRMFATLGADVVGMSTVPGVIVAIHSGLKVIAMSVVTNMSNIFHSNAHTHEDVQKAAELAKENLEKLISQILIDID
ncbi:MAG: purine-nucleoside phosphorylase [Candidatus Zophobacter franzmannii]|nr:purine-nucleoside phosphorylase [Candidatus Zophobacter franzmannii]